MFEGHQHEVRVCTMHIAVAIMGSSHSSNRGYWGIYSSLYECYIGCESLQRLLRFRARGSSPTDSVVPWAYQRKKAPSMHYACGVLKISSFVVSICTVSIRSL